MLRHVLIDLNSVHLVIISVFTELIQRCKDGNSPQHAQPGERADGHP